jgi:hypothetical protein
MIRKLPITDFIIINTENLILYKTELFMKKSIFLFLVFLPGIYSCSTGKLKSFTPGEIWPDNNGVHINAHGGGILYRNGVYYWYGEHKTEGKGGNVANVGFRCYSSKDLYNWKDEGIVLPVVVAHDGASQQSDIVAGAIMERPKVIYNAKTGKYVMWFHLEPKGTGYGGARSGLAVADKPTGPFTYIKSLRPDARSWPIDYLDESKSASGSSDSLNILKRDWEGGQMARDMTLFVDDDGKAYHIFASEENNTLHISLLTDDYLSHTGKYARFFVGRSMEAPAMFKKDGKYFLLMSGCTGWSPNAGRSAVASSIWGPWTELKNPFVGNDSDLSFHSQSTYVLPVVGKKDHFLYLGDRWTPDNAIDGRYVWLPLRFDGDQPVIEWIDEWRIGF